MAALGKAGFIGLVLLGTVGVGVFAVERRPDPSYVGAFTDFDFYVLAIGADLRTARRLAGGSADPDLEAAAVTALAMHRVGIVTVDSGWLFQPGVWRDYPDHRFAGVDTVPTNGTVPPRVEDVAPDVSHFSRWPLFLRSHEAGWAPGDSAAVYYHLLRDKLAWQFRRRILVPPGEDFAGWRTRNYMDGRNGVYRWDYRTHRGRGYLPYQLSGTLLHGWWGFLGDPTVRAAYADMASRFPYDGLERATYTGPWGRQPRLDDGRFELQTLLAAALDGGGPVDRARVRRLWEGYGPALLARALWRGPDAESAQYDLMVPLHYAFEADEPRIRADFDEHFRRAIGTEWPLEGSSILPRLHYMYFASRYLVLAKAQHRDPVTVAGLETRLLTEWRALWGGYAAPVSSTGWGEPAFNAYRPYLEWKLDRWRSHR